MAGITVGMAVTFGHTMLAQMPSEPGPAPSTFQMDLAPGPGGWSDGDETVRLDHRGGAGLDQNDTVIRISVGTTDHTYQDADLDGGFSDGTLTIGESWSVNLTVPPSTTTTLRVVRDASPSQVVEDLQAESGSLDCSDDQTPPSVSTWSQEPDDIAASTTGSVDVTVTAEDTCSGVNTDTTPHLWYRFDDTDTFTDAGSMTRLSGATWQGSIPEPTDGWDAHAGQTLVYRVDPLEDQANNTGVSENRSDAIEADGDLGGELTYVTDHVLFSGTLENFTAAQNGTDGGDAATLTENETSPNATTSEAYGTAYSSSTGTESAGSATGSPDGSHALIDDRAEWIGVEGFQTFSGEIVTVEVALEGHYDGTTSGSADELELAYRVGTQTGETKGVYDPTSLNESTDGPAKYINVTGDRDWTWTDVEDLQVRSSYERNGQLDDLTYAVDALWVRVTYDNPSYNMSIRGDVDSLPSGSHDLELRYAVSDETHHVQVWNFTADAWEQRGRSLSSSSMTDWSLALDADEVEASETRFRIVDDARDADQQSTVDLDYARVRTR